MNHPPDQFLAFQAESIKAIKAEIETMGFSWEAEPQDLEDPSYVHARIDCAPVLFAFDEDQEVLRVWISRRVAEFPLAAARLDCKGVAKWISDFITEESKKDPAEPAAAGLNAESQSATAEPTRTEASINKFKATFTVRCSERDAAAFIAAARQLFPELAIDSTKGRKSK